MTALLRRSTRQRLLPSRAFASGSPYLDNSFLKSVGWWDKFYKKKEDDSTFDWFEPDVELTFRLMQQRLAASGTPPDRQRILHLGCGTSAWCELLEEAFPFAEEIVHLDASVAAVAAVRDRLPDHSTSRLIVADARDLPFYGFREEKIRADATADAARLAPDEDADSPPAWDQHGYFDAIVDKGTLDVFLTQGDRDDDAVDSAAAVVAEAYRCLRPGGAWFMVSTDAQELRTAGFERAAERATAAAGAGAAAGAAEAETAGGCLSWRVKCQDVSLEDSQYGANLYTADLI